MHNASLNAVKILSLRAWRVHAFLYMYHEFIGHFHKTELTTLKNLEIKAQNIDLVGKEQGVTRVILQTIKIIYDKPDT